ncbi:MAG: class I SAM-dependent methyltransferase [Candidatus Odinarchaeota archaeon]
MTRKNKLPKFPNSYLGEKSYEYENSKWMERNQKKATILCLQYLYDEKLDNLGRKGVLDRKPYLILDLGCGTGFSSEVLISSGLKVIGVDVLLDMLIKAKSKIAHLENGSNLFLILADMKYLPIRTNSINHIFSISAYNFILYEKEDYKDINKTLNNTAKYLRRILKSNGRIIIEFYPKSDEELNLFSSSFTDNGFNGFMIKQNPKQKKGQTFLLLKRW